MDKMKIIIALLCSLIIAVAIIIGSAISSSTLAERPLMGTFSGSLTSSYSDTDITTIDGLIYIIGMLPSNPNMDYDAEMREHRDKLKENILSGKWPDFPYVKIGDELYFSKDAVTDWFTEKGKTQLVIE